MADKILTASAKRLLNKMAWCEARSQRLELRRRMLDELKPVPKPEKVKTSG